MVKAGKRPAGRKLLRKCDGIRIAGQLMLSKTCPESVQMVPGCQTPCAISGSTQRRPKGYPRATQGPPKGYPPEAHRSISRALGFLLACATPAPGFLFLFHRLPPSASGHSMDAANRGLTRISNPRPTDRKST